MTIDKLRVHLPYGTRKGAAAPFETRGRPTCLSDRGETGLIAAETDPSNVDAASPLEALVEFLYLTPVGIIRFRPDGTIEMANPAAAQVLMPLVPAGDLSNFYQVFDAVRPGLREQVEAFRPPAGQVCEQIQLALPASRCVLTLCINKISHNTFMAVVQDISNAIEQESRLRNDQQRFRAIFDNIRDYAICTADIGGWIDEWNRSLHRLGGWLADDLAGASVEMFFVKTEGRQPGKFLLDRARRTGSAEFEGWCARRNGSPFWGNTVATALPDRDGVPNGFVLVTRDLTERKHIEDRLLALASIDPLTSALNRRAGDESLDEAFRRWQQHQRPFVVLMADCDHFKIVNDR